ncbi:MAG: flagellar basal-body rod protein FlgF [Pseudomonadota bacterium]
MENASLIGLSRQIVLGHALDVAANNIANQSTAGFKGETLRFETFLVPQAITAERSAAAQDFALVHDPDSQTDFSAGSLIQTGAPLDFAISGDGFFATEDGETRTYTRDGHFSLNSFGELVTRTGSRVLDESFSPIFVDPTLGPLTLSAEGEIQQQGQPIARLGVFTFEDRETLTKRGQNQFISTETPTPVAIPRLEQGFIEASNVAPIEGMTELIKISRAYANAAQLIETSNELSRDAIRRFTQIT